MTNSGALKVVGALLLSLVLTTGGSDAGEADVVAVEVEQTAPGVYAFHVTLLHGDESWDYYADRWDVVGPDGTVLGSGVLAHPTCQRAVIYA